MHFNFKNLSPWLDDLPFNWDEYKSVGTEVPLKKNSYVFHTSDTLHNIYIVLQGRVRLFLYTPEGKEKTVIIVGKNGLLGEHFLSSHDAHSTSAITVSNSTLLKVEKEQFEQIAFSSKFLTKQWLEVLSLKLEILTHTALNLSFDSSSKRIAQALVQLATIYGIEQNNGIIKIKITFTHQELADLIGSSRVTVSNEMNKLQKKKIILKPDKHYYIQDIDQLKLRTQ